MNEVVEVVNEQRDDLGLELGALGLELVLELFEATGLLLQVDEVVAGIRSGG